MAGLSATITFDDRRVIGALDRLGSLERDTKPLLDAIGTGLVASTEMRFQSNTAPDGTPWAPLNPAYAEFRRPGPILVQSAALMRSITFRAGYHTLRIGSPMIYAGVHQWGATIRPVRAKALAFEMGGHLVLARKVTIPARPYLGISDEDEEMILETVDRIVGRILGV